MTGIEPFLGPAATGLTSIIFDIAKKAGGKFLQVVSDQQQATEAAKRYAEKYQSRYGWIKLLGMQQAVALESVYTTVRALDELSIRRFESLEALEQSYRKNQKRRLQIRSSKNREGIEVANEHQFLMVLGAPGTGKSIFLRRVGLEALKGKNGKFKHQCIPVFLELKRFETNSINLKKSIAEEFQNFGFPNSDEFATKALEQGKLIVLLDGLDEISTDQFGSAIEEIQNFVSRYDQNRFICSCRVASYNSSFQRFTDVELLDFDDVQIQQFIQSWFQSELDKQTETARKCWQVLNQPNHRAAKELAQNPLLLTFLCLIYNRIQDFPTNRATLYRKALDIFLDEWAAEKRVRPGEIYKGLNTDLEKVLLSEIAYQGFVKDRVFFTSQELIEQIKSFLSDTIDKPKYLDGRAVLDAIVIQQGILVERAEDIFSFSHLIFQEYLTAQYISQDYREVNKLVSRYLTEQRWREIFLIVSGLLRNADEMLELIETSAQKCVYSPKLKSLLIWAEKATNNSEAIFKVAAKRAVAIFFALALARTSNSALDFATSLSRALDLARVLNFDLELTLDLVLGLDGDLAIDPEIEKIKIFGNVELTVLIARLKALQARFPDSNQSEEVHQAFVERVHETWLNALQLKKEWIELSEDEAEALANYLYANELMVRCKEAAVRVSQQKWDAIEARMLTVQSDRT
jgi:predicted NACHT family NTPase